MAVVATARKKRILWLGAYALLSSVLAVWGAYDYWVRIPNHERQYAEFTQQKETLDRLEAKAATTSLSEDEKRTYSDANGVLQSFKDSTPEPVPAYDRPLQLWVYIVGCGVLGVPWLLFGIVKLRRQRLELDNEGNITLNGQSLKCDQIQSIDMARWMSKSTATVRGTNGESLKIDDYLLQDAHLIVGRIANRFSPELWNADGTKVKASEEAESASNHTASEASDAAARDSH
ncbi:MAG: hypothetical protein EXS17_06235 [Phycisphaerales bacterium]|nr:hypothetical protein [Phycisphaerales bacterium]